MGDYLAARQRRRRIQALVAAFVGLVVLGTLLYRAGARKADFEARISGLETRTEQGDYEGLKQVALDVGEILATDDRAELEYYCVGSRAELLIYFLYSGAGRQRSRAKEMLDVGLLREPNNGSVLVTQALWEALEGSGEVALSLLANPGAQGVMPSWQAVVRAEVALRAGKPAEGLEGLSRATGVLPRLWETRLATLAGNNELSLSASSGVLASLPGHKLAQVELARARARSQADESAAASLEALLAGDGLTPLLAASLAVDLSRLLRRLGGGAKADKMLDDLVTGAEVSPVLLAEAARVHRFRGRFGTARSMADVGLRQRADQPDLLVEFSSAAFFNDAASTIDSRLALVPGSAKEGEGVVWARGIAALARGGVGSALSDLAATRSLGAPGEGSLWLGAALIRAGRAEEALKELRLAVERFEATFGSDSREVAIARMYEGLALTMSGDAEGGRTILQGAFSPETRTPWSAWVYGRFHEQTGKLRDAKDAYLLACHNGQDFALACFDLSRIYDSLELTPIERSTQREARRHYLRSSSKGVHSDLVRAALGQR